MRCVLIGYGYWGKIIEKYILQSNKFELVGICDSNYLHSIDLENVLKTGIAQCAFVCVPIRQHYSVVKRLLEYKLHVFCEKPLCHSMEEMLKLINLSEKNDVTLFTDYIYTVSPSLRYMRSHLNDFGKILYVDMHIKQFGRFYECDDVFEVIGVHMVSALFFLFQVSAEKIQMTKVEILARGDKNLPLAGILFFMVNGVKGKIECSLLSDEKERKIKILCERGLIVFDMMSEVTVKMISNKEQGKLEQSVIEECRYKESDNLAAVLDCFYHAVIRRDKTNRNITEQVGVIQEQIKSLAGGGS